MVVVSTVPIPYRFIALMQKCNRLFAYPLELLAGEIRATGFQCSCCGTCCTRSVNGHIFLLDHDVTPLFSYNDIAILLTDRTGCDIFQFHPVHSIPFSYIQSKSEIMETYWCEKKISIIYWINKGEPFSQALAPCLKAECDKWRGGECIHIRKAERRK
jgi:hypothetical protein